MELNLQLRDNYDCFIKKKKMNQNDEGKTITKFVMCQQPGLIIFSII